MTTSDDLGDSAQQRFGRFAERYVTSKAHAKGPELDRLVEIARPQPDWIALDIATGGGHTALEFAPLVTRMIATDIAPNMLAAAEAFITTQGADNVTFKPANAEDLPFENKTFDLVTCRIAPHHFHHCAGFVRESARVLRPSGVLLVQDHVLPEDVQASRFVDGFEKLRDPSHNRAFSESEWTGMFQSAGLKVVHIEQIIKSHDFIPWTMRQGCTAKTVERLASMLQEAPAAAAEWMLPRAIGAPGATFVNHHILIAGRKQDNRLTI